MHYSGGCHCGRIAFEFDSEAPVGEVIECNCSLCSKRGHLLAFVPRDKFTLKTPEKDLSTYTFNTHRIRHHFCSQCGCGPFGEAKAPNGIAMASINMRCVEGFEPGQVKFKKFDGRSR